MYRRLRGTMAWILIVSMTCSPSLVYAQAPAAAKQAPAGEAAKIDLSYVTPESCAAVVVFPRRVLTAPHLEMLPVEVITAAGMKELGIDPMQIEQLAAIVEPPVGGPPGGVVVVHLAGPLAEGKILGQLWDRTTEDKLDGKTYRKAASPMEPSIYRPDDKTLLVGTDDLLRKVVANHASPKEGKMTAVLGRMTEPPDAMAVLLVEPIRPLWAMSMAVMPVPPQFEDVKKLPDLLASVGAKANVTGDFGASLSLKANDEAAAQQIEQIIDKMMAMGRAQMLAEAARMADSSDPVQQAMAKYQQRMSERMMQALRPVRNGATLTLSTANAKNPQMAALIALSMVGFLGMPIAMQGMGSPGTLQGPVRVETQAGARVKIAPSSQTPPDPKEMGSPAKPSQPPSKPAKPSK